MSRYAANFISDPPLLLVAVLLLLPLLYHQVVEVVEPDFVGTPLLLQTRMHVDLRRRFLEGKRIPQSPLALVD